MEKSWVLSSSIGRKFAMALSAIFLLVFLVQHLIINLSSVFSEEAFNELSHFMGTNPLIQFVLQPVLIIGILFHFIMGIVLELKNRNARGGSYAYSAGNANASWVSKNMIISGAVILLFLGLHMYGFWWHEMQVKYISPNEKLASDANRYYTELVAYFKNPIFVSFYVLSFLLLGLHLNHGFQSSFQSVGMQNKKYKSLIKSVGTAYSILVPFGFALVAIFHFLSN